jgi:hypothetical protein
VGEEFVHVPSRVRHDPELQAVSPELRQYRRHIVEEIEVLGVLPGPRHLERKFGGPLRVPAHAADDALGERDPDLFVVAEIGMLA